MTDDQKAEVQFLLAQMRAKAATPSEVRRGCDLIETLVMEPAVPFHAFERPQSVPLPDGSIRFF